MNKPQAPRSRVKAKPDPDPALKPEPIPKPKPKPKSPPRSKRPVTKKVNPPQPSTNNVGNKLLLISLEILGLVIFAVSGIIILLGYASERFSGTNFLNHLLPFAIGVLVLILATSLFLIGWWKLRQCWRGKASLLTPVLAIGLAVLIGWFVMQDQFAPAFDHFRTLVGGKQEAERVTLRHQVYAAYRRHDPAQLHKLLKRAQNYNAVIDEAAKVFDVDENLLKGIAATESSFIPRDSLDGGHGLFQITRVPKAAIEQAGKQLSVNKPSLLNPRHNAFIAAATFKYYLDQMKSDLFLGLLAYNIGPTNGGLRFIMQKYGVTDFVTIQPYLQTLPRDYPIRVLAYSLAFRLWQKEGRLPAYEEGKNAVRIQRIGIPGL